MRKAPGFTTIIVMAVLIAALFTSCAKSSSDLETFKKLAEKNSYEIHNVTDQYINSPQIKTATIAAPKDRNFQIEFYTITDVESAQTIFQAQGKVIDSYQGNGADSKVSNGKNYAKRTVVTKDNKYLMVSYINNTVLYVPPTDKANRKEIEKFIKDFNY